MPPSGRAARLRTVNHLGVRRGAMPAAAIARLGWAAVNGAHCETPPARRHRAGYDARAASLSSNNRDDDPVGVRTRVADCPLCGLHEPLPVGGYTQSGL